MPGRPVTEFALPDFTAEIAAGLNGYKGKRKT